MPFQEGNKLGGRRKEKPFRDALMLAIKEAEEDKTKLRKIADRLVERAIEGDVPAIKEVADRLDGKVPQDNIHAGDEDRPVRLTLSWELTKNPEEPQG